MTDLPKVTYKLPLELRSSAKLKVFRFLFNLSTLSLLLIVLLSLDNPLNNAASLIIIPALFAAIFLVELCLIIWARNRWVKVDQEGLTIWHKSKCTQEIRLSELNALLYDYLPWAGYKVHAEFIDLYKTSIIRYLTQEDFDILRSLITDVGLTFEHRPRGSIWTLIFPGRN